MVPHCIHSVASLSVAMFVWLASAENAADSRYFVDAGLHSVTAGDDASFAVAFSDVDADGDLDIFVTNSESINRLYINSDGRGAFIDATSASGLEQTAVKSRGVAFADVNGDGFLDAFISATGGDADALFLGNGKGKFVDMTSESGVHSVADGQGVCFADVDRDGDLDLFVANYGQPNLLYINDGDGIFEEDAEAGGLGAESTNSFACVFGDVDNDGDLDLYVTNAGSTSKLYLNDGAGAFTDVTEEAGAGGGNDKKRGAQMADFNGDGNLDLIASGFAKNLLLLGDGSGSFSDATESAGVGGSPEWKTHGVAVGDFDGDGDVDIWMSYIGSSRLFLNDGSGVFADTGAASGVDRHILGQGVALGDLDGDGALDAYITSWGPFGKACLGCDKANMLLMNQFEISTWLKVRPVNGDGFANLYGAEVRVFPAGTSMTAGVRQRIDGGGGMCSQGAYEAHFGLIPYSADKGEQMFDIEVRCGGQWVTKADDPKLGNRKPNQVVEAVCDFHRHPLKRERTIL